MRKLSCSLHALFVLSFIVFLTSPTSGQSDQQSFKASDTALAKALFEKAEAAINNGKFDSTEIWLAQALPLFKNADKWEYQVKSYHLLCGINYRTGRAAQAEQLLDTALQILSSRTDSSDFLYGPWNHNRATVFYVTGNYPEAKKLFLKAIETYKRFPEQGGEKIISSYNNLGLTFIALRDYENAITYLKKCLDLNLLYNPTNKYLIGRSHNNLGMAYFEKGHSVGENFGFDFTKDETYQKAEGHYHNALSYYKQVLSPPNIALGQCCLNLANIASARQNMEQSIAFNKQALLNFGVGSDNPYPQVSMVYYNTGIAYKIIGQLDSSRYYVNKAIEFGEWYFGEKHHYLSDYYNYLGRVFMEEERPEDALRNFQQSLIIACINFEDTIYTRNPPISEVLLKEEAMNNFAWKAFAFEMKFRNSHKTQDMEMAIANYYFWFFSKMSGYIIKTFIQYLLME
jgi:tetratricopeptide (TPR) repeat protein